MRSGRFDINGAFNGMCGMAVFYTFTLGVAGRTRFLNKNQASQKKAVKPMAAKIAGFGFSKVLMEPA